MLAQKLLGSQLPALRSQMNPHFIFNALNSIQDYILSNQKEFAGDYLGKFADLMRIYLNHSKLETLSLADEVKALNLYLELEKLRFEDSLDFSLDVDANLDQDSIRLPSLIIQPFVENAIKHGLLHKSGERILRVAFSQRGNNLICLVEDNGVGRAKSEEINAQRRPDHESHASSAIQQRIALLNKSKDSAIQVSYNDLCNANGKALGTSVEIRIPLKFFVSLLFSYQFIPPFRKLKFTFRKLQYFLLKKFSEESRWGFCWATLLTD